MVRKNNVDIEINWLIDKNKNEYNYLLIENLERDINLFLNLKKIK